MPDLVALVQRVVRIFQPGRLSLTLFISSQDNENENGSSAIEEAQRAFKAALTFPPSQSMDERKSILPVGKGKGYRRTDKINYEFGDYDLAFASFELL